MRPVAPMRRTRNAPLISIPTELFGLGEKILHAFQEAFLSRRMLGAAPQRGVQLPDQLTLLGRELHGGFDHDLAEQVTARAAAHRLDALVTQAEHPSGLGLRRNLDGDIAVQGRYLERTPE